jgi:hypothetical protein
MCRPIVILSMHGVLQTTFILVPVKVLDRYRANDKTNYQHVRDHKHHECCFLKPVGPLPQKLNQSIIFHNIFSNLFAAFLKYPGRNVIRRLLIATRNRSLAALFALSART